MVYRASIFFLLVCVWVFFEGCTGLGQIIDKSTLSTEEIEKVEAVRLIEANELNEGSYKVIQKVKGISCEKRKVQFGFFKNTVKVVEDRSRKKAIEQLKIYAMRAGANAITNWACVFDAVDWTNNCWNSVECQADAIQVD